MSTVAIRQSGGANIVSIPQSVLKALDLHPGSPLDLSIVDNTIVLTPVSEEFSLEAVLIGSPKERLKMIEEDKHWISQTSIGKEVW
jgi:antitoxin ChpS